MDIILIGLFMDIIGFIRFNRIVQVVHISADALYGEGATRIVGRRVWARLPAHPQKIFAALVLDEEGPEVMFFLTINKNK